MKNLMILITLIAAGCTQSQAVEPTKKVPVRLPDGTNLVCQEVMPFPSNVSLRGCESASTRLLITGNLECRHGVCWSTK